MKKILLPSFAMLVTTVVWPAAAYGPAELLFTFADTAISESSGIAPSATAGVWFTHNDSGDRARFFAVGSEGQTLTTFYVAGAAAYDWEDMARGPSTSGAGTSLFFADIGDNSQVRPAVTVYELAEPAIDPSGGTPIAVVVVDAVHTLVYDDAGRWNAEAFLVDPAAPGTFLIVTKERYGTSRVFQTEEPVSGTSTITFMHQVATFDLTDHAPLPYEPAFLITAGDVAPDRSRIALRTYEETWEWTVGEGGFADAFASPPYHVPVPVTQQGEALAYTLDGRSLVLSSEGEHAPVYLLPGD